MSSIPGPELVTGVVHPEEVSDEDVPLLPALRPVHEVVEVPAGKEWMLIMVSRWL